MPGCRGIHGAHSGRAQGVIQTGGSAETEQTAVRFGLTDTPTRWMPNSSAAW